MRPCRAATVALWIASLGAAWNAVPVRALDLETVLREVAGTNPTLAARRSMVEAARHRVGPAGAWESPMAEIGVMNVPVNGRFDMDRMTMKSVGLRQRVPLFGSNGLQRRSAREALAGESAAAEMEHFEVYGMAWSAYADAYYAGRLTVLSEQHQGVMDRLVEAARARYESGSGRLEDVLRAESEQARTIADLAAFRAAERSARAALAALRGLDSIAFEERLAAPPVAAVPAEASAWLDAVEPAHPQLRELDAQSARYRWAARAARRMVWPDLILSGSYGRRQTLEGGIEQDNMFSAMVGFMVPIFAPQSQLAEGAEMDAMARAGESERRARELMLRQEVLAAHATAVAAERTTTLLADTVVATQRRAVEASWSAYVAGSTDLWRVFEATHTLYVEEIALIDARRDLARTEARFLSLTGRGDLLGITLPTTTRSKP